MCIRDSIKKEEINPDEIIIATPKKEEEEPAILRGRVEFFNEARGCLLYTSRWMIRRDSAVDFGIWKSFDRKELIVPLDTHVCRVAHYLDVYKRQDICYLSVGIHCDEG